MRRGWALAFGPRLEAGDAVRARPFAFTRRESAQRPDVVMGEQKIRQPHARETAVTQFAVESRAQSDKWIAFVRALDLRHHPRRDARHLMLESNARLSFVRKNGKFVGLPDHETRLFDPRRVQ